MYKYLKTYLAPPVFEDDEKTRTAKLLNTIILTITILSALNLGYVILFTTQSADDITILVTVTMACIIGLFSIRRGWVNITGIILLLILWGLITYVTVLFGGVRSPTFGIYLIIILCAGLFWGGKASLIVATISILTGVTMFYAENNGLLPASLNATRSDLALLDISSVFIITTVLLHLARQDLINALENLHRNRNALKESNRHLANKTKQLEDAQERLIRQEKLAVLGQLAGGVGHELRNPLGVISNAVYFLEMVLTDADETTQEYLQIISSRVKEADKIVADLLNLSRNRTAEQQTVTIIELVNETLTRHPAPDAIQLNKQLPNNLPSIFVDPQHIQQVLSNLITNAYQAMPDGGELTITAKVQQTYLHLSISDTGQGMSSETLEKIFEPLFTTKAKGIGLGLVVCKNLIEINKGKIEVESVLNTGSTFSLILPAKL